MASRFETAYAASAVAGELFQHGEDVTYTPSGGQAKTIKAIVERESRESDYGGTVTNEYNSMVIHISARTNSEGQVTVTELDGSSSPDTVAVDGSTWIVRRKLTPTLAGMHTLEIFDKGAA